MTHPRSNTITGSQGEEPKRILWLGLSLAMFVGLFAPPAAEAIPAYGRRYNVSCSTCHAPLPPRLNNLGILFRKSGFRMPDADDQGRLILNTVAAKGFGDAVSLMANVDGRYDDAPEGDTNSTTFELGEVEATTGTAIGKHVSAQAMFVLWNEEEGAVELENAEVQYNGGSAQNQFVARGGLLQTYLWQKANHGALTLSMPLVFDEMAVAGSENFAGFGLGANQIGVDLGYIHSSLKEGKLSSTMVTAAVLNGVNDEGERALRNTTGGADVYLQAQQLFGPRNTVGAFYYTGRTALEAAAAEGMEGGNAGETPEGTAPTVKQYFTRYGVRGNYVFFKRLDVVAGGALGTDRREADGIEIETKFRGFFAEADIELRKRWILVYRFDAVDPDKDQGGDTMQAQVASTTWQAEDHVYLTAEYRRLTQAGEANNAFVINARLIY